MTNEPVCQCLAPWKVTTCHTHIHQASLCRTRLPIKHSFYAASFWDGPDSSWDEGEGFVCVLKGDCSVQQSFWCTTKTWLSSVACSAKTKHTLTHTVVLITSICLKLRESAASCWFHRHVKTPLFFSLPLLLPPLPVSACPLHPSSFQKYSFTLFSFRFILYAFPCFFRQSGQDVWKGRWSFSFCFSDNFTQLRQESVNFKCPVPKILGTGSNQWLHCGNLFGEFVF